MNTALISAFIVYFVILIGIGLTFYKRNQSASSFLLGNQSLNYWVTAIATQASDMGSWLFIGLPAIAFSQGLFEYWAAVGLVSGMFLNWKLIAPKLRKQTEHLDSLTLSSYLGERFKDKSGSIQIISTFFGLLFAIFYIASGLVGLSILFNAAFGISYEMGILLSLLTTTAYTLIGGFTAVAWCDFFQGIFLLIVIMFVPSYALYTLGSIAPIIAIAHSKGISLSLISGPQEMLQALFLAASWGLGYFGQPHILVNFMGIDDPANIVRARNLGITWQILVLTASTAIGIIGIGFFPQGLINTELVFIDMTLLLFPPFIAGLMLCALLAATLSTMDSLILVSGGMISEDLYKQVINPKASSKSILLASRIGALVISSFALILALTTQSNVYHLVNYAWSGLGSTFGPLVITSLYNKNITYQGALAGIIIGGTISTLLPFFSSVLPLVPGFIGSLTAIYFVSYLSRTKTV